MFKAKILYSKKQSNLFRDIQIKQTVENTIDDLHRKSHQCPTFRTNICTSTQNNRIFVFPLDRLFTDNRIAHHHNSSYQYQRPVHVQLDKIVLPKAFYDLWAKEEKQLPFNGRKSSKCATLAE